MLRGLKTLALLGAFLAPLASYAGLGMSADSVNLDMKSFNASVKTDSTPSAKDSEVYKVYEFTDPQGAIIRECVSSDGNVFAISWRNAMKRPDLSQLLGPYYSDFQANDPSVNSHNPPSGRTTHIIRTKELEVHAGGHMRDMRGHAFVQKFVPVPGAELECLR